MAAPRACSLSPAQSVLRPPRPGLQSLRCGGQRLVQGSKLPARSQVTQQVQRVHPALRNGPRLGR